MNVLKRLFIRFAAKMEKGRPVGPPSAPPPQDNYTPQPYELFLPYAIQEYPRTFLHLLKTSPELSEHLRQMVEVWLQSYDQMLYDWLQNAYGPGVGRIADTITRQVMQQQQMQAESEAKRAVDNQISDLETQFKDGDDAS